MTTRLFLIRHGATVLTAEDRFAGSTDVELSDAGCAQAKALARRLADDNISSLLSFDARGYRDRLDQSPACLNVLDFKSPVRARLMVFNDVSHYVDQPPRSDGRLSKWWDRERP